MKFKYVKFTYYFKKHGTASILLAFKIHKRKRLDKKWTCWSSLL